MQISEGQGWRLQVDPVRQPFAALLGGGDWAIELDLQELACLRRGILTLLLQLRQLQDQLMPEEQLDLELDLSLPAAADVMNGEGNLFIALSGSRQQWSLRFVLTPAGGSRAAEGAWTCSASAALAAALEGLPGVLNGAA